MSIEPTIKETEKKFRVNVNDIEIYRKFDTFLIKNSLKALLMLYFFVKFFFLLLRTRRTYDIIYEIGGKTNEVKNY